MAMPQIAETLGASYRRFLRINKTAVSEVRE